ncbi:MAG: hypothetical protein WA728_35235, partial [Xanthobacteraceae bacterium]
MAKTSESASITQILTRDSWRADRRAMPAFQSSKTTTTEKTLISGAYVHHGTGIGIGAAVVAPRYYNSGACGRYPIRAAIRLPGAVRTAASLFPTDVTLRSVRGCNEGDEFPVTRCGTNFRPNDCTDGTTSLKQLTKMKLAAIAISSFAGAVR